MASLKDLRTRIGSVKNTQQTTKAMKMVSAAKLRRSQESVVANRPYAREIGKMIQLISSMTGVNASSPLIRSEASFSSTGAGAKKKNILLVLVVSDRGLCGGFNGNVVKFTSRWVEENQSSYASIELALIGKKGSDLLKTRGLRPSHTEEFGRKASFDHALGITQRLIADYSSGKYDAVYFVYNEFKNAISQKVVLERFLPVFAEETDIDDKIEDQTVDLYLVKPGKEQLLQELLERHFAVQAYRVLLESQASEHGARMSAMENATKNAGEMVRKLQLSYNKSRQAAITKELLEIVAGSESQKN